MAGADDVRSEYKSFRERFRDTSWGEFQSGDWFAASVKWVLESYADEVDAAYIRRRYPGAGPRNQARQARRWAARTAGIAGGASAAAISSMEVVTVAGGGLPAPVLVPAIATSVMADVAYTTRLQLRTVYDLSVIHRAPLLLDEVEDCHLILMNAMGIKLGELGGQLLRPAGPSVIAYNVRRILRSGLRKALQKAVQRVAGSQAARKITERALMRLAVPFVNVVVSSGMNSLFTRRVLTVADRQMRQRGAVVQPLIVLFKIAEDFPPTLAVKAFIVVMEEPRRDGWDFDQLEALRQTQAALALNDEDIEELEEWFDKDVGSLLAELPPLEQSAAAALIEYLTMAAALDSNPNTDEDYSAAIGQVAEQLGQTFQPAMIPRARKSLR